VRFAAAIKGGFYPCPPPAIELALQKIDRPAGGQGSILDPCAGEGAALRQLAEGLGLPLSRAWAIELEGERGRGLQANLPGANVLGPGDFFLSAIQPAGCFSLCWCNPPFDDEIGGGQRVEYSFLQRATQLLAKPGGILLLVCPERIATQWEIRSHLMSHFDHLRVVEFPASCRRFTEVMVFGVRRP